MIGRLKREMIFGLRVSPVPGGLAGPTETTLPIGTRVEQIGMSIKVLSDAHVQKASGQREWLASAKGEVFSIIDDDVVETEG